MLLLSYLFSPGLGLLVFFNKKSYIFGKCKGPFSPKVQMQGNANSSLYSRGRSSNKPFSCAAVLDYRRIGHRKRNTSAIKTKIQVMINTFL